MIRDSRHPTHGQVIHSTLTHGTTGKKENKMPQEPTPKIKHKIYCISAESKRCKCGAEISRHHQWCEACYRVEINAWENCQRAMQCIWRPARNGLDRGMKTREKWGTHWYVLKKGRYVLDESSIYIRADYKRSTKRPNVMKRLLNTIFGSYI